MDIETQIGLVASVDRKDVYVCRDRFGFWAFFSELLDKRWIVEYVPHIKYDREDVLVLGPFGVRERLPIVSALADVDRVVLTVTDGPAERSLWVAEVAALVSSHSISLSDLEPLTSLPWPLMEGVSYEISGSMGAVRLVGSVELYGDKYLFRLDTGDEFPVSDVRHRLWPAGSTIRHVDEPEPV